MLSAAENPPLYLVRKNVIAMMAAREYIVEEEEKTREEYVRDFCYYDPPLPEEDDDSGEVHHNHNRQLLVNKDLLTLSLVHKINRTPMRVFFFASPNNKFGKKQMQLLLDRMGENITRAVIVVPDGCLPTPPVRTMIDQMNRGSDDVFIQCFSEAELTTNRLGVSRIERKFRVLTVAEKRAFFARYGSNPQHYPFIAYDDPLAKYLGLQRGDVLKCERGSETAGRYAKYQVCRYVEEMPKEAPNKKLKK